MCFKSKFWLWKEFIIDSRFALRVAEIAPNWPKEVILRPKYEEIGPKKPNWMPNQQLLHLLQLKDVQNNLVKFVCPYSQQDIDIMASEKKSGQFGPPDPG